jgi:predicted dehydrogenase
MVRSAHGARLEPRTTVTPQDDGHRRCRHSLHCGRVIAAVYRQDKHVFCEKPLSLTKVEGVRMIAAREAAGVVPSIGTDKRFHPASRELARLVKDGALGRVAHLEAPFSNEVAGAFVEWRFSPEKSSAGGLTDTGVHMLDALIELREPVRRAQALLLSHKPPPDPLDSLAVVLEFESGTSGTLTAVRSTPMSSPNPCLCRTAPAEMPGRTDLVLRHSGSAPRHLTFP